jgi:maltose O-acetyltransferase
MSLYVVRKLLGPRGRVSAWRLLGAHVGRGVTIGPRVAMRCPANVTIGSGSAVGGTTWIDAWDTVTIGRCCLLNDHIDLLTGSHKPDSAAFDGHVSPIVIGDYVWLPRRIIVLPGVTIGRGAVVGTGSVVVKDVPALAIVGGNPAKVVGRRADVDFSYVPSRP